MKSLGKPIWTMALTVLLNGQSELPKDVIQLSELRRDIGKSVANLDNYTCVETIDREERKDARRGFQHVDTVNVEVAVVNDHELYSWPGAKFEDREVGAMVGGGLMSTGSFRSAIRNVLINNGSTIRFHGDEDILGRRAIRWDYTIPYYLSRWDVEIEGRRGRVSETGSFWVDAGTLELLRLETAANDIPPDLRVTSIRETLNYARVRVESRDLLLPQSVETSVTKLTGVERLNRIEFSHCREFRAAAELTFNEPKAADKPASPMIELYLPACLEISVRMTHAIDSKTAAVGDRISAVTDAPVRYHRTILIPKGALLEGRIHRLERRLTPRPYYLVGIEFTDMEFPGHHARFIGQILGIQAESSRLRTEIETTVKIPGVSIFFLEGTAFHLPEGMQMTWFTTRLQK